MARAKKSNENSDELEQSESIDLVSLLTLPGQTSIYELEVSNLTCKNGFELPQFSDFPPENLKNETKNNVPVSSKPLVTKLAKPIPQFEKNENTAQPAQSHIIEPTIKPKPATDKLTEMLPPKFSGKLEIIPGDSLERVREDISKCEACGLCKLRQHVVPGEGNASAKLMFIGEAPGADEDKTGIPFVGAAGLHLDKILAAAGIKRDEVFICNILKCRPPNNRDPHIDEMVACTPFLKRQIQLVKPKIIACLGNIAVKYIIGPNAPGITRIHGQWADSIFGIKTMALYHPSYLIRSESRDKGSPNWQMWQDIKNLKKVYDMV